MPKILIEIDPNTQVVVPRVPTHEMIKAMNESVGRDDEGEFPAMMDLLDFSGENKSHTVLKAAYKAMLAAAAQPEQPAPIPTAWQPIETAPTDVLHVRGVVVCSANGIPTHFECHAGYVDRDGDFIDTAGDWNGWSAEDYTHWHPLAGPPAPGGDA